MGNDLYLKETIIKGILAPETIFTWYGAYKSTSPWNSGKNKNSTAIKQYTDNMLGVG